MWPGLCTASRSAWRRPKSSWCLRKPAACLMLNAKPTAATRARCQPLTRRRRLARTAAAQTPKLRTPPVHTLPNQSHLPSLAEAHKLPATVDASRRANARPRLPGHARPAMRGTRAMPAASPKRSAAACTPRDEPPDAGPGVPGGLRVAQGPLAPAPGPLGPPPLSPPAPRFKNGLPRPGAGLEPGFEPACTSGFEAGFDAAPLQRAAGCGRSRAISGSTSRDSRATLGAHSGLMASVGGGGGVKGAKRPGGPECPYLRGPSPASAWAEPVMDTGRS